MLIINGNKKVNKDDNISKNFKYKEFQCKNGDKNVKIDMKMVNKLQELRDWLGVPIIINSAYRTPTYNKKVGGATNSQHVKGTAIDIRVEGYTPLEVAAYGQALGFDGIGVYNTFTHLDTRGSKARWGSYSGMDKVKLKPRNKPSPQEDRFETGTIKFKYNNKNIETLGLRLYKNSSTEFLQYIALQDLKSIGFDVEWSGEHTIITKSEQFVEPNLNLRYLDNNVKPAKIKIEYTDSCFVLDGYYLSDKHGNKTQFISLQDLGKFGLTVNWDNNKGQVVLNG